MLARRLLGSATRSSLRGASPLHRQVCRPFSMIVHDSPHPKVDIPNKTIWDVVGDQLSVHKDKPAFIDGITHEKVTFEQIYERARNFAVALAKDGVKKGDVVILHSFNCLDYPMAILALTSLGAVCSPASHLFLPDELAASFIITHKELEITAVEAAKLCGVDKKFIYTMGHATEISQDLKSVDKMVDIRDYSFKFEKIDPETNVLLPFSSGTTGIPKGAAKVILPRFDHDTFLNALSTYKIRTAHIAPPLALFLAHHPVVEKYDISATKYLVSAGAPMGKGVEKLVKDRLGITMKQAYGMTEASPGVNYGEEVYRKSVSVCDGSVGRLLPNTQLRVKCTATGVDLPIAESGELLYKGPQVMIGYSNNAEANKSVFTEDRFLRTGDIGYIDSDGFVFIVDRVKELIKYKGHQVAPAELEDVLNHHPQISDACCIRGKDAFGEEIPKAYVVLKDPTNAAKLTEEGVMDFVASKVAPFKKVRQVEFIDAIPKSATGKILRRELQVHENQHHKK
ncbi:hypothetical protein BBO99_00005457 [Phytophthora kernoviae]|uniref:AMP-dependent synthetase/ligase domain-containing protein n=1 Tax=Phytophthora kernoviae TaxID=325452 RepID=A0A3R7JXD3_9STRA|nr:hypothetical protein BBI17_005802 [Phytophthora kernoviae]RLN79182.1 hypothetical protein BBO99_00005457 [Phytophthora kernoviae]